RFGPSGAATATFIVAAIATWNAALGIGPFAANGLSGLAIAGQLYVFLAVASVSSLIPAAMIRERRTALRERGDSERRYRELFETSPQPMWVFDRETLRFLAVNK